VKIISAAAISLVLLAVAPACAQRYGDDPRDWDRQEREAYERGREDRAREERARDQGWRDDERFRDRDGRRWVRGERLPERYRGNRYRVREWREARLPEPPRGYRWVQVEDAYVLAGRGWVIADVVPLGRGYAGAQVYGAPAVNRDREELWRQRYSRAYALEDDPAYRECRNGPDPAGVLAGAVLGGVIGNVAGSRGNRGLPTVAGVIAGGAIGAALTNKMDCEDRSYAYRTYAEGFNGGRPNAYYDWRNPRNDHRGRMHVLDYYNDEDGFRCAVYAHEVTIGGRPEQARGRACQQPDGAWAIID
jgi:Ni/Co efflux regulator RcnB/surface antigen